MGERAYLLISRLMSESATVGFLMATERARRWRE
jgi:hypothetical protein